MHLDSNDRDENFSSVKKSGKVTTEDFSTSN